MALASVALLLSACGGADKAPRPTPTARVISDPQEFAESLLLTRAEFPAGWVHKAAEPEPADGGAAPSGPLATCLTRRFDHEMARAIGGEWSDRNTTMLSINPSVFLFDDAAHAEAAAETIIAQVQCFADTVGDGLDVDETFAFGPTYTEPLEAAFFGATHALREYGTQIYKTSDPPDSDVLVFDVMLVVRGRVVYRVDGFRRHEPIDSALLRTYVGGAAAKLESVE